jgi:hypothetical protein
VGPSEEGSILTYPSYNGRFRAFSVEISVDWMEYSEAAVAIYLGAISVPVEFTTHIYEQPIVRSVISVL